MKRLFIVTLFFIVLGSNFAHAEENVGLLPTNPFYFIKEWQRGVKSFFTVKPFKRAELELQTIREKAAEIRKLQSIDSAHFQLDSYLEDLMEKTLQQVTFYFESGQKTSAIETIAVLPFSPEQWLNFKNKLEPLVENRGIQAIIFLKDLEKLLPDAGKKEIGKLKADLLLRLKGNAIADIKVLNSLPIESLDTIEILDALREYVDDGADLKSKLNQIRQAALDWAKNNSKVGKVEAERAIILAENLINSLEQSLKETNKIKLINLLENKAKYNLEQAKASLNGENYSDAFGQASLASASASRALALVSKTVQDSERDIKKLKVQYDRLIILAKDKKELTPLFNKVERLLIKSADLLAQDGANPEQINSYLEETKVLLAQI